MKEIILTVQESIFYFLLPQNFSLDIYATFQLVIIKFEILVLFLIVSGADDGIVHDIRYPFAELIDLEVELTQAFFVLFGIHEFTHDDLLLLRYGYLFFRI